MLEAARAADWHSFEAFVDAVNQRRPETDEDEWRVRYTALDGTDLEIMNPGPPPDAQSYVGTDGQVPSVETHLQYRAQRPAVECAVDGVSSDYAGWPSIECPFVRSEFGSGLYIVEAGGEKLTLDFRNWSKEG